MARGGGGRGGGGGGSSGSSSSCGSSSTYPCSSEMIFMYGNRNQSLYSEAEVYGQLVMACIWAFALIAILLFSCLRRTKGVKGPTLLHIGISALFASFVFLCVRYGIIVSQSNVLVGYRYESSVVELLWRAGWVFILAAAFTQLGLPKGILSTVAKIISILGLLAFAALSGAYVVFDFIVSADGLDRFKDDWVWRLGDRDFAMTMNNGMIEQLKTAADGRAALSPRYIMDRMWDEGMKYLAPRTSQIQLGVAKNAIALVLVLWLMFLAVALYMRSARTDDVSAARRRAILLFLAGASLLLSTLFNLIVAVHYVYWNWSIVTNENQWLNFISSYPELDFLAGIVAPDGFLEGYRATVMGFPVVQAVLVPLGVVLASGIMVLVNLIQVRSTGIGYQERKI